MPVTVKEIFKKVGLKPSAAFAWGNEIPEKQSGVYVISLSSNSSRNNNTQKSCEISDNAYKEWKSLSPELTIKKISSKQKLESELNKHWMSKENILYIGQSSKGIQHRINQLYKQKTGKTGNHKGGYWIKLLCCLKNLSVYYAVCDNPAEIEFKMLMYFIEQTSGKNFYKLKDLGKYLPFANLKADFKK